MTYDHGGGGDTRSGGRHDRLSAGDVAALADLTRRQYAPLVARLASRPRFRRVDPQRVSDAVVEALMECVAGPRGEDNAGGGGGGGGSPAVGRPPESMLPLVAERNLLNLLRSEGRRKRREQEAAAAAAGPGGEPVELHTPAGNTISEEDADRRRRERQALLDHLPDPADRRVLELQLDGVRSTAAFADVLGLGHLPDAEQRKAVKRAKDRIDKVLRRAVRRGHGGHGGHSGGGGGAEAGHG